MSLELDDALAKKPTVAHWIDITRLLDETPEADLPAAVARVEEATKGWPTGHRGNHHTGAYKESVYYEWQRYLDPDPEVEVRIAPRAWVQEMLAGVVSPKFSLVRVFINQDRVRVGGRSYTTANKHLVSMLECEHTTNLTYLRFNRVKLAGTFFKGLEKSGKLDALTHFALGSNPLTASAAKAMCAARLPALRSLELFQNDVLSDVADVFASDTSLNGLVAFGAYNCYVSERAMDTLTRAPFFPNLEVLDLNANSGVGDAALEAIAGTNAGGIEQLVLNETGVTDAGLEALVGASHLTSIRELWLSKTRTTEQGVRALIEAPHLQGSLRRLVVGDGFTLDLAKAFVDDDLLPELDRFDVVPTQRPADGVDEALEYVSRHRPHVTRDVPL